MIQNVTHDVTRGQADDECIRNFSGTAGIDHVLQVGTEREPWLSRAL